MDDGDGIYTHKVTHKVGIIIIIVIIITFSPEMIVTMWFILDKGYIFSKLHWSISFKHLTVRIQSQLTFILGMKTLMCLKTKLLQLYGQPYVVRVCGIQAVQITD